MGKKKCNHNVGLFWGHEESSYTGDLVYLNELDLDDIYRLKNDDFGRAFSFCPNCGENIDGVLGEVRNELIALRNKENKEAEKKKKAKEKQFNDDVLTVLSSNGFELMNENDGYLIEVKCTSKNYSPTKNSIKFTGTKNYIAKNVVHNKKFFNNLSLDVISIQKLPSKDELIDIVSQHFDTTLKPFNKETIVYFNKDNMKYDFSYIQEGGVVYLNIKTICEDGDVATSYKQLSPKDLLKEFGIEYEYEKVK